LFYLCHNFRLPGWNFNGARCPKVANWYSHCPTSPPPVGNDDKLLAKIELFVLALIIFAKSISIKDSRYNFQHTRCFLCWLNNGKKLARAHTHICWVYAQEHNVCIRCKHRKKVNEIQYGFHLEIEERTAGTREINYYQKNYAKFM
jgi:hypothetical protein